MGTLIFARCFLLRETNWTQVGWFNIETNTQSVYSLRFKHFVNHQLKFLLNNFNYSGISIDQQRTKESVLCELRQLIENENIERIYCHVSVIPELRQVLDGLPVLIIPTPPVDRVFISATCLTSPNHNNISCVKCILNNLATKISP